ncbi:MAG: DUF6754 domain-containing protein [Chloroflexota bacterium]
MWGLGFVFVFLVLLLLFAILGKKKKAIFREIPAFKQLINAIGLAVEEGKQVHFSLGRGSVNGPESTSSFIGLSVLERIGNVTCTSDFPVVATTGEGALGILTQDVLRASFRGSKGEYRYDTTLAQISGLTPFSYAVGTMRPVMDERVSVNVLMGHYGSEVAFIGDAIGRGHSFGLAGSDSLVAQALMYATVQETLIGEEYFASGAYLGAGNMHLASLRTQDVFRWMLVLIILIGSALKLMGVL